MKSWNCHLQGQQKGLLGRFQGQESRDVSQTTSWSTTGKSLLLGLTETSAQPSRTISEITCHFTYCRQRACAHCRNIRHSTPLKANSSVHSVKFQYQYLKMMSQPTPLCASSHKAPSRRESNTLTDKPSIRIVGISKIVLRTGFESYRTITS